MTKTSVRDLESKYIVQTYRRTPIVLVRGKGARVFDEDGREYLDMLAGIGVGALGHGHEGLARAIAEQAREMIHCSNLFFHPLQVQVAERLARLSGLSRTFFCNSGAEAVEGCLKFARRYWYTKGDSNRTEIIAMEGDFHGRTYGALSVTWDEHYRAPFAPLLPNITFVPVNDPAKLRAAVSGKTAAIILEPIQGEGGVRPLTQEFAHAVTEMAAKRAVLETSLGTITLEFFPDRAPNHVRQFLRLAQAGVYDGTAFHRLVKGFVIQGGFMPTRREPPDETQERYIRTLQPEFNDTPHDRGTLSMARGDDPASASTSFFIVTGNASSLDGKYTVFGRVVDGLPVVDAIEQSPVNGETPVTRIELTKVRIVQQ